MSDLEKSQFQGCVIKYLRLKSDKDYFLASPEYVLNGEGNAYVWRFGELIDQQFLVFLNPHTGLVPSAEHAWLFIVDEHGNVLKRSDFDTGWRMYSSGASFKRVSWLPSPVLIQEMRVGLNGAGPRKIYIGFDGLRPAVVRIDDASGAPRKMDYYAPNWVVGPHFNVPSKTTMLRILKGANGVQLLESLVWLDGNHVDVFPSKQDVLRASTPEEKRYLRFIRDRDIAMAVRQLRGSANPYVQQLAKGVPIVTH